MPVLTIRNLPDEVHRALRVQAAQNGRSTEAEVREILASAVKPQKRLQMGDALAALGKNLGLSGEDVAAMEKLRDTSPAKPHGFD